MLKMAGIVERLRQSTSSSRLGPGKAVSVYDGRKWPVVKCGAVYVTDEERTKSVTKHVISLSASQKDDKKKPKSSKYTVAIGSSFGHIHTFLKESDNVLKTYENTKAEDKCLLLIKKPKSASKQMLKAHSWADVSVGDMHIRNSDGTFRQDPYKTFKDRFKKKTDLSLPPDQWNTSNTLPNQRTPFKGPTTNQSNSFKTLSSVEEKKEVNNSDVSLDKKCAEPVVNISNSYPFIKKGNNRRSQSLADLTETGAEINNNMGGALSQKGGPKQKSLPLGPPPPKPQRAHTTGRALCGFENGGFQTRGSVTLTQRNATQPDVLGNAAVVDNYGGSISGRDRRAGSDPQQRIKHDSGFHSEIQLPSDELYDSGFKQDLSQCFKNGKPMTSSPINVEIESQNANQVKRTHSNPRAQPQVVSHGSNQNQSAPRNCQPVQHIRGNGDNRQGPQNSYNRNHTNIAPVPTPGYSNSRPVQKDINGRLAEPHKHNMQPVGVQGPVNKYHDKKGLNTAKQCSPVQQQNSGPEPQSMPRSAEKPIKKHSNEFKSRKSLGDVTEGQIMHSHNSDVVTKAQSLGDLSVGCTFSLVGQKKVDSNSDLANTEFTGSQLMKHIRNYRELTQNGKNGSFPIKGKTVDDMDNCGQYSRPGNEPIRGGNTDNKLRHYGSLQHLPMSFETYNAQSHPNISSNPKPVTYREKTPLKPRRLPQTPGDAHEKKRQISDMMKSRMSVDSASSNSSSGSSAQGAPAEPRSGGISATPSVSDREVSELFHMNRPEKNLGKQSGKQTLCNNNVDYKNSRGHVPPSYSETCNMSGSLHKSNSFGLHDQGATHSGGRLSESGQTTLTSQSTIDSGYITNDPDPDTMSTSTYAKTLKQSAQSLYVTSKLYQTPKSEPHQSQNSVSKGDSHFEFNGASTFSKGDHYSKQNSSTKQGNNNNNSNFNSNFAHGSHAKNRHYKDSHTRNWLENHPGTFVSDQFKLKSVDEKVDKNNNRHPKIPEDRVTEIDLSQSLPPEFKPATKQPLSHHKSEVSARDADRLSREPSDLKCRSKGKSISMSQGLNMIGAHNDGLQYSGSFLSKSQTKFTGSLKDLIGTDKQIVPIETLRLESANSTNTLPVGWKFQNRTRSESSLKFLGKPSVFQLLQNYNLYAVRLRIPDNFDILDYMRVIECEVVLSTPWLYGKDSTSPMSPKGSYAKLGGPNSAFRPVAVGGSAAIKSVSMMTVMDISNQLKEMTELGQLQKGDLLIEVNEMLMMGEDLAALSGAIQSCQGELLLTVARDKARDVATVEQKVDISMPTDDDFRRMEQKLTELTTELRKKDRTLKQLSSLLPWKLTPPKGSHSADNKDQDGYVCSLSEDEFIV